jgi:hypothetical protein
VKPPRRRARPHGYVATGPGFYVWEPTREEARRAARDLSPPSAAKPIPVPAARASARVTSRRSR